MYELLGIVYLRATV